MRFGIWIALDIAEGIYFLHFVCDPPVIHCDIKASNVLLDCGFRAKLADYRLASVKCGKAGGYCQAVNMEVGMRCGSDRFDEKLEGEVGGGLVRCVSPESLCRDVDLEMSFEKQGSGVGTDEGREQASDGIFYSGKGKSEKRQMAALMLKDETHVSDNALSTGSEEETLKSFVSKEIEVTDTEGDLESTEKWLNNNGDNQQDPPKGIFKPDEKPWVDVIRGNRLPKPWT